MKCEYCEMNEGIETDATHERVTRPAPSQPNRRLLRLPQAIPGNRR